MVCKWISWCHFSNSTSVQFNLAASISLQSVLHCIAISLALTIHCISLVCVVPKFAQISHQSIQCVGNGASLNACEPHQSIEMPPDKSGLGQTINWLHFGPSTCKRANRMGELVAIEEGSGSLANQPTTLCGQPASQTARPPDRLKSNVCVIGHWNWPHRSGLITGS